ncbi:sorting assembly machinery 37 kDa subunit [[Candida] anglica]|uniref:Sorting assembly machinery 37 kDa subunit n=1 Tax=[Candida] anglica TaxID=148631 RepID=A0ABP0EB12_9ASCO
MTKELHVWGNDGSISLISPECLASAWILALNNIDFTIITSNNTNLSPTNQLPILIDNVTNKIYDGYTSINGFINAGKSQSLIDMSLSTYIASELNPINQYNLYINTKNYEHYTRKLFGKYFPFPMMYNQPLKFYYVAQELVRTVGLNSNSPGFFSLSNSSVEVAETETINDDSIEVEQPAVSSLHEKQLIAKSKQKQTLQESRYTLKCLHLLGQYINHIENVYKESTNGKKWTPITVASELQTSYVLLVAYIKTLTSEEIPDRFIDTYLVNNHPELVEFCSQECGKLDKILQTKTFREAKDHEIPNLWNEVKYITGMKK